VWEAQAGDVHGGHGSWDLPSPVPPQGAADHGSHHDVAGRKAAGGAGHDMHAGFRAPPDAPQHKVDSAGFVV
jgi:hypothetical protein